MQSSFFWVALLLAVVVTSSFHASVPRATFGLRAPRAPPPLCYTCRLCKATYSSEDNGPTACRSHPGSLRGESARKGDWEGTRGASSGDSGDLVYTWSCCGAPAEDPGCLIGFHTSYDDDGSSVATTRAPSPSMLLAPDDDPCVRFMQTSPRFPTRSTPPLEVMNAQLEALQRGDMAGVFRLFSHARRLAIEDGARRDVREFNVQEGAVYAALASMLASSCPGLVAHDRPEVIASFGDPDATSPGRLPTWICRVRVRCGETGVARLFTFTLTSHAFCTCTTPRARYESHYQRGSKDHRRNHSTTDIALAGRRTECLLRSASYRAHRTLLLRATNAVETGTRTLL